MCVLVCVMHCVPPQELQGRLEKAIFAYVILAGPHFLGYAGAAAALVPAAACPAAAAVSSSRPGAGGEDSGSDSGDPAKGKVRDQKMAKRITPRKIRNGKSCRFQNDILLLSR